MNKKEFVEAIVKTGKVADAMEAGKTLDAFLETVSESLAAGDPVSLAGLGTLKVVTRHARVGRNPKTGEEIEIPACKAVKFTPAKNLKETVGQLAGQKRAMD